MRTRRDVLAGLSAALFVAGFPAAALAVPVSHFGVRGDGSDDRPALQAAIDVLHEAGGGTLVFPMPQSEYVIHGNLKLRAGVSLVGDLGRPTLRAADVVGEGRGDLFVPGNFHPDFVENFTYHPAHFETVPTKKLSVPALQGRILPGEFVYIGSEARSVSTYFEHPQYAWLNEVMAVEGDLLTLRYPVDIDVPMGVARLADETCRFSEPAFVYANAEIRNLTLVSEGGAISDSALLNIRWRDCTIRGTRGIYGNCFQHCSWENCEFFFTQAMGEQSLTSLDCIVRDCRFVFSGRHGSDAAGMSLQECGRRLVFDGFTVEAESYTSGHPMLRTLNTQDCVFRNGRIRMTRAAGCIVLAMGDMNPVRMLDRYPASGNRMENLVVTSNEVGAYARIDLSGWSRNNVLDRIKATGKTTYAVLLYGGNGAADSSTSLIDCHFETGKIVRGGVKSFRVERL